MITLFPFDNTIEYQENDKIEELELSTRAMEDGKIKNIPIFESELKKMVKQKKWITLIRNKPLTLLLPMDYNEKEKEVFLVILENIGFHNIKTQKVKMEFKKNQIFLEIHKNYINKIYKKKTKIIHEKYPCYIFGSIENTISYIIKNHPGKKRFYFIGNYPNVKECVNHINQRNVYYYLDSNSFIIRHASP